MARDHAAVFLEVLKGEGFAQPNPRPMFHNPPGLLRVEPHSPGLRDRIWWGAALDRPRPCGRPAQGMNLQSSTLIDQRVRRPLPRAAGQADPGLPRRLEGSGPRARAARLGQPLHLRADRQARLDVLRRPQPGRGPGRLHRRRDRRRSSAAPTPPSRTSSSSSSRTTRPSPPPTPCCSPSRTSSASSTTRTRSSRS